MIPCPWGLWSHTLYQLPSLPNQEKKIMVGYIHENKKKKS